MRPLLVGEANPYSDDPAHALLPWPARSAGARLCRLLDLEQRDYLRAFARANLCVGKSWRWPLARESAAALAAGYAGPIVVLGSRVAGAFGLGTMPLWSTDGRFTRVPHPSGLSREWNKPGAVERLRHVLRCQLSA